MGPFDRWPTGSIGFDYFYGFLAGETSQWEPRLFENINAGRAAARREIPPDRRPGRQGDRPGCASIAPIAPDKPFLMYWAPGAAHGPHHIFKEWADKYKGKFDDGWDALRERVFKRQKELGWIPADTKLTPRAEAMAAWDSIPEAERPFQRRLMEVFAGFVEHADAQAGKLDRRARAAGHPRQHDRLLHLRRQRLQRRGPERHASASCWRRTTSRTRSSSSSTALDELGGLDALGGPKTDNMYHAGWAWAGNTPFQHTKLVASHFGGTRNPLAISWPKGIKPDKTPRPQFHHVNDIVPTIYDILGIKPPKVVDGFKQDPIDGVSMAYTFADATAPGAQEGRSISRTTAAAASITDGWYACDVRAADAVADRQPRAGEQLGLPTRTSGSSTTCARTSPRPTILPARQPKRLERDEGALPRRGRRATRSSRSAPASGCALHPEDRVKSPYTKLDVRRDDHAHAGIHRARPRPREQPRHDRRRARRERLGRALCARRRRPAA